MYSKLFILIKLIFEWTQASGRTDHSELVLRLPRIHFKMQFPSFGVYELYVALCMGSFILFPLHVYLMDNTNILNLKTACLMLIRHALGYVKDTTYRKC